MDILHSPCTHRVYNLTVEREHVYYVSHLGTLVHNNGCVPLSNKRLTKAAEEIRGLTLKGWKKGKGGSHFTKHGRGMGYANQKAYTDAAKALAKKTDNVIEAKIGNTLFKYDKKMQNILIVNGKDRVIKTFHRAHNGIASFKKAMKDHWDVIN
ncbi:MAG: hypothetical protein Tsb009_01980 [Planctomycetaceae bacterium]